MICTVDIDILNNLDKSNYSGSFSTKSLDNISCEQYDYNYTLKTQTHYLFGSSFLVDRRNSSYLSCLFKCNKLILYNHPVLRSYLYFRNRSHNLYLLTSFLGCSITTVTKVLLRSSVRSYSISQKTKPTFSSTFAQLMIFSKIQTDH